MTLNAPSHKLIFNFVWRNLFESVHGFPPGASVAVPWDRGASCGLRGSAEAFLPQLIWPLYSQSGDELKKYMQMVPSPAEKSLPPKGVYLPISKLHSITKVKFVTAVKFHYRVLQLTAVFLAM